MKHTKQKGNLGFSATVKELHKLNANVFVELGDLSKVDLIAEFDKKLIRFQVKYATEKNGVVRLCLRKSGPNGYRYHYTNDVVDIFSIYLPEKDIILFIPSNFACQNKTCLTIRFDKSKNNQEKGIHSIQDFSNLKNIINSFLKIVNLDGIESSQSD